jgi:hypothetical protein
MNDASFSVSEETAGRPPQAGKRIRRPDLKLCWLLIVCIISLAPLLDRVLALISR